MFLPKLHSATLIIVFLSNWDQVEYEIFRIFPSPAAEAWNDTFD